MRGRADPFGLLVLGVMFALFVTVAIQAQASIRPAPAAGTEPACLLWCQGDDGRY